LRAAPLYLASSMLLVGANVALGKLIVATVPVMAFLLLRGVVSCLCFAPEFVRHHLEQRHLSANEKRTLFLQAFVGMLGYSVFMLYGVQRTSAVAAGVITGTLPAVAALLSWLFLRERLSRRVLLSIALAMCGVVLLNVYSVKSDAGESSLLGNMLVLCAVVCEASYVVLSRHIANSGLSAMRISAFANWYGLLCFIAFGVWTLKDVPWQSIDAKLWMVMIWYVFAASVLCFWLWMKGAAHVSASRAGVFTACLPIAAAATGVLLLGEQLSAVHVVAFVLVVSGVWLAAREP
jgi:drug/metabolite transporter (DMT)-like permease